MVVLEEVFPLGGVVNNEFLASLFRTKVDPSNVGVVVVNVAYCNLDNAFVDKPEGLKKFVLEIFVCSISSDFFQTWSEQGKVGVVFLVVEVKDHSDISFYHQIPHFFKLIHSLLNVTILYYSHDNHSLLSLLSAFFFLDHNRKIAHRANSHILQELIGFRLGLDTDL